MVIKTIIITAIALFISADIFAQTSNEGTFNFTIKEDKIDLKNLKNTEPKRHFLGEQIALKLELLRQDYLWVEKPTPTRPTPLTVIEKPAIYNSIKKLERYYKKALKSGFLSQKEVITEFEDIIDIALYIRYQYTESFESTLYKIKETKELVSVYTEQVKLTSDSY